MIINIADKINSILQCTMFILTINYCIEREYKKNNRELITYIVIMWIAVSISYKLVGNSSLNVLITHIISIGVPCLLFKKNLLGVVVAHTIIYFAITINLMIGTNILFGIIYPRISEGYIEIFNLLFIYLPQIIMALVILKNLDKVNRIYKTIKSKNLAVMVFFILSLIVDFIVSFNLIIHGQDDPLYVNIMFFLLSLFLIVITLYFANSEKKAKEIHDLNIALEEKVFELKKIKHDYGSQISYLYALHLMKKHDRLGELLKGIIDGHNSITDQIQVSNKSDSIIANIVNSISTKDIKIIIDEQAKIEEFPLEEIELQRVISNIITNSVTAMNGRGIISIRTLYEFNKIIIKIENNGPQIDKSIITKIFEEGFSTKEDDAGNHGYGLSIVKDIVEKQSGKIELLSNNKKTEFKIIMPIRV